MKRKKSVPYEEGLYKMATLALVLKAMGLKLSVEAKIPNMLRRHFCRHFAVLFPLRMAIWADFVGNGQPGKSQRSKKDQATLK